MPVAILDRFEPLHLEKYLGTTCSQKSSQSIFTPRPSSDHARPFTFGSASAFRSAAMKEEGRPTRFLFCCEESRGSSLGFSLGRHSSSIATRCLAAPSQPYGLAQSASLSEHRLALLLLRGASLSSPSIYFELVLDSSLNKYSASSLSSLSLSSHVLSDSAVYEFLFFV